MLSKNLEFNQLQREVLLKKPKILGTHKNQKWGKNEYIYVGKSGSHTDITPSSFDVSSADELKIVINSRLDKAVRLDEMRVYNPIDNTLLHTVNLLDYYPLESLTIQAGKTFTFGKKEMIGLTDVNVFDDTLSNIIFILRSDYAVLKRPTEGREFDFTLIGRV